MRRFSCAAVIAFLLLSLGGCACPQWYCGPGGPGNITGPGGAGGAGTR